MKNRFLQFSIAILVVLFLGCTTSSENNSNFDNLTDIDGNVYESVTICNQTWTKSNLNVSKYSDGTPIPQVTNPKQWINLTTGAWCYFNNDPANEFVYGKLYNWYAVAGIYDAASLGNPLLRKKLSPSGWHIPTDIEWTTLTNCLGGREVAGGKMKETGISLWQSPNIDATNSSGFSGLPGGYRSYIGGFGEAGSFGLIGSLGYWWTATEYNNVTSWWRNLDYNSSSIGRYGFEKQDGLSVRCVKD